MIIQFHTPKGIVEVDTEVVTDNELAEINMDRQKLDVVIAEQPRDPLAEIDEMKKKLKKAGIT